MATGETDPQADAEDSGRIAEDVHAAVHDEEPLGPIDWGAWAASLVGIGAGAVIALAMFVSVAQG